MKVKPSGNLETDDLGRISAWKQIHIVDSSIFPSLPGTTIGLLTMANAYRIVDKLCPSKYLVNKNDKDLYDFGNSMGVS